ncbi:unnamed protein product [Periconia digitata]|uniref:Peptidase A1 domain-containing protein n=1 Tax=Periconia digitata TaxID=1303443 RepID=A0A9W4XL17_9PLEO|nr:unnamed protein product [Periconia digitata]
MTTGVPAPLSLQPAEAWVGNDGSWSGFVVQVGTPPQNFTVLPATSGQHTYVPSADDCQRTNLTDCGSSRGVSPFANQPSPGFQTNASSTWDLIGIYELGINSRLGYSGGAVSGYETLNFGTEVPNGRQPSDKQVVTSYVSQDLWIGTLGLGYAQMTFRANERVNSTLVSMQQENLIPSQSFGYTAGASYRKAPASLTLGGYDESRTSKGLSIPLSTDDPEKPLTVGLQSIVVANSLNGTQNLLHQPILIPIDSAVTELWLPESVCEVFAAAFDLQYQQVSGRYAITEETRTKLRQLNPKLTFTISDGFVQGRSTNIDFPYSAFDLQAEYPIFPESTSYFPIRRAANDSQYVLGRVFLQETYIGVDYERETFNVSQAAFPDSTEAAKIITITSLDSSTNSTGGSGEAATASQLSGGAIAGIVVGAVIGVGVIAALIWFFFFRRARQSKKEGKRKGEEEEEEAEEMSSTTQLEAIEEQRLPSKSYEAEPAELHGAHGIHEAGIPHGTFVEMDGRMTSYKYAHGEIAELPADDMIYEADGGANTYKQGEDKSAAAFPEKSR